MPSGCRAERSCGTRLSERPLTLLSFMSIESPCSSNMGKNSQLPQDKIALIVALKESGLQTKDIVAQLGVSERSVRRWVAKFYTSGKKDTSTHERRPERKKKTNDRCRNIVKQQLELNPRTTARKIKEENSRLLGNVYVLSPDS